MIDKFGLKYMSATYRVFKCSGEKRQDGDYLQVTYNGGAPDQPDTYKLSGEFSFQVPIASLLLSFQQKIKYWHMIT